MEVTFGTNQLGPTYGTSRPNRGELTTLWKGHKRISQTNPQHSQYKGLLQCLSHFKTKKEKKAFHKNKSLEIVFGASNYHISLIIVQLPWSNDCGCAHSRRVFLPQKPKRHAPTRSGSSLSPGKHTAFNTYTISACNMNTAGVVKRSLPRLGCLETPVRQTAAGSHSEDRN